MNAFLKLHQDAVVGNLATFDRMIFKGYLTQLFPKGRFPMFLSRQGVLLKDFGRYVQTASAELKAHAQGLPGEAGRPYLYLESATTKRSGRSGPETPVKTARRRR